MAEITKALSIDVARANVFQAVVAKQNDSNSRFLEVTIMNEGTPIEIAQNSTITINAAREDGNSKSFLGTVGSDGKVVVPLTNWMLALDGNVRCDITIVDSENRKLTTTSFMIAVEEAAYLGTDISEDEDYDLLTQLLTDCTTAKTACETAAAQANSAVENLDSAIEEKISELQPALTFDTKPTKGSTNPVTSDGINTAINNLGVATAGELARYVLKETGKSLSSNDYTDAEKQKNADNTASIAALQLNKADNSELLDYVKFTDYASADRTGVVRIDTSRGICISPTDHVLYVKTLDTVDIGTRSSTIGTLSMDMLNTAVKAALTDSNRISGLTDSEKAIARGVIDAAELNQVKQWFAANTVYAITVMLNDHSDNRITHMSGDLQSLTLSFPSSIEMGYECSFSFKSGSQQAISLNYPDDTVKFVGVDCDEDGDLIPTTNRNYEVVIKNLATDGATPVLVARVGVY